MLLAKTSRLYLLGLNNFWKVHHFALASRYWIKFIISVFIWAFTYIFLGLWYFFILNLCRSSWFWLSLLVGLLFKIFFHCICTENFSFWNLFFWCWITSIWRLESLFTRPIIDSLFFTCTSFYADAFTLTGTLFFKCVSIVWFCVLVSVFACFWLT